MNLFEFEGKKLLGSFGITIPKSELAVGGKINAMDYPFVLKAQVLTGGRGKAGGVKVCKNEEEFKKNYSDISRLTIKGFPVCGLLAEEMIAIDRELYIAITLQGTKLPHLIASASGGMDIETLAKTQPEKILHMDLDPFTGLTDEQVNEVGKFLGLADDAEFGVFYRKLEKAFFETDAMLTEINPLCVSNGKLVAADSKVVLDDHAQYRHQELFDSIREGRKNLVNFTEEVDDGTTITFVPLEGNIGLISDGAGTGMLTLDVLTDLGGKVASFCELGGTTPASTMYKAMEYTMTSGQKLDSLLIVLIGGFNRMDDMANGITQYINDNGVDIPIFTRMVGNMEEVGLEIMKNAGLKTYSMLTEAAKDAVNAASEKR